MSPIEHLLDAFPKDIRFAYRHFPLSSIHDKANISARAAEAAGRQGSFFEYHHLLYERVSEWSGLSGEEAARRKFAEYAVELGLSREQFEADLDAPETVAKVDAAYQHAVSLGLGGTPTFFLNGQMFDARNLSAPVEQWAGFIEAQKALSGLDSYEKPAMTIDLDKEYLATVETEKGTFVIQLYPRSAPETVNSFVFLANEGWFNGITFHRVLEGFMAQTGDPSATGMGGPGYLLDDEIDTDLKMDGPGWVAMANSGPNTNGSQWFITYSAQPQLDGMHPVFGYVIEGMDVVESITPRDPAASTDLPPGDMIISITIEER